MCNMAIYNNALIVKCQLFGNSIYKITFTGENERFKKKRKWKSGLHRTKTAKNCLSILFSFFKHLKQIEGSIKQSPNHFHEYFHE